MTSSLRFFKFAFVVIISASLLVSCSTPTNGDLFSGSNTNQWDTSGNVSIKDSILILTGTDAQMISKKGNYKSFDLSLELRTTAQGKGFVGFHTDKADNKGYRVAINNDRKDATWWRMTGSLMSVRNLTKSFIKENEWFKMNIRVEGQSVTVLINDQLVMEYIEPEAPYRIASNAAALLSEGHFSLVSNGAGEIQVKNIKVGILDDRHIDKSAQLANAINEQEDDIIRLHQEDFPVLDYHVHLKGGLTKEEAAIQSRQLGINYAIAPNCGVGFPITNDQQVMDFLNEMRSEPFILAMQAEGREWVTTFSPEVRNEFDYVFTDALTFTDNKNRRTRLWIKEETWIEDEQQYMDMIVDKICGVLQEPVDVYVNPCFLPYPMNERYDEFWTEARMDKFVDALAKSGKALEINELYNIPNRAIIQKAKDAGVKFTFGSNNVTPDVSRLGYSIRMKNECGLTPQDMYKPKIKI